MSYQNNKDKKKMRNKKRRKQKIRLYIRRLVFLSVCILIVYLFIFFVKQGISTVFKSEDQKIALDDETKDNVDKISNEDETNTEINNEKNTESNKDNNEINDKEISLEDNKVSNTENDTEEQKKITREQLIMSGTVYEGIFLDELDISGMNYDSAIEAYNKYLDGTIKRKINFKDSLGNYQTTFNSLGVKADVEKAVTEALTYGRSGNILERYKEIETLKNNNVTIIPEKTIDRKKLEELLSSEAEDMVKDPVNSSMIRSDGQFIVYESEKGLAIDYDKTADVVEKELEKKWGNSDITLTAATIDIEPQYTEEDFYGVDTLLGRCVTEYNVKNSERIANLAVGAHKIADNVLLPGQQFSVYNTVAPFTEENGYHNAGQYINAELVDGLGGGICQVATTLYDAVLESELQVDERYPHSMIVSYVDKGMDAAIAEGYQDFKFTNNTDYPIYIDAYAGGGYVSVAIYGHESRSPGRRIEFESQVIETYKPGEERTIYDDTLPSGTTNVTDAHTGYYVEVWKHIYQDGVLTDSVKINGSEYQAVPKTTRIGTMQQ